MPPQIGADDVSLELFLGWLAETHGRRFQVDSSSHLQPGSLSALCSDGSYRLAVEVRPLLEAGESEAWQAQRRQIEAEIADDLQGSCALWLPPGADLPVASDQRLDLVKRVREVALSLEPGQRSQLLLPATIYLHKSRDDGAVMSVVGPLDIYWARMSERVHGAYELDSRALHRLPESEEHRNELRDRICGQANEISEVGELREIETVDAWTIQRLGDGRGVVIIGLPPDALGDTGITVRRNLRRLLIEAGQKLSTQECDLRALVVLGIYPYINQEGATTALRGYDPTLYSTLDFICLVADGQAKSQMESPVLPWAGRR